MEKIIVIFAVILASLYFLRFTWSSLKSFRNLSNSKTAGCKSCGCSSAGIKEIKTEVSIPE
jgi:hypothetical protein